MSTVKEAKESFENSDFSLPNDYEHEYDTHFSHIRKTFVPNLKVALVTRKFYARHDAHHGETPDPVYVQALEDALARVPKERYTDPQTENQRYGWDTELLLPLNKSDRILNHHRLGTKLTKTAAEIWFSTRDMPKNPPFVGIPFRI